MSEYIPESGIPHHFKGSYSPSVRRDLARAATLSGGFEAGREPGVATEEVAEGVEFADAPFRGG